MSTYGHRQMMGAQQMPMAGGSARLNELLEAIRQEFEAHSQDNPMQRMQREDFEHKLSMHVQEMSQIQQNIFELERMHQKMKQQYEEEIFRLRRELEARGGPPLSQQPQGLSFAGGQQSSQSQQAPPLAQFPPNGMTAMAPGGQQQQQQQVPSQQPGYPAAVGQQQQQIAPGAGLLRKPMPPQHQQQPHGPAGGYVQAQMGQSQAQQQPQQPPQQPQQQQQQQPVPQQQSQQPQQQQQQQPQQQHQSQQQHRPSQPLMKPSVVFEDVDSESVPASFRQDGPDWLALFNPKIGRSLDVALNQSLDHSSVVCCVKYSRDGKMVATGCNRVTQIFDATNGQKIASLVDEKHLDGDLYIRSVCFSPDGHWLATGAEDRQIRLWDVKEKRIKRVLMGHEQDIYSLDFSRDGRLIASGSGDRTARVWEVESGKCLLTLGSEDSGPKDAGITSVAISPDGQLIAAGSLDRIVRLWDIETGKLIARLEGHKDSVYSVAFSPDGRSLISGSLDKTLKLWDLNLGSTRNSLAKPVCRVTFNGHKDFVLSVAFSADGKQILSGSKDRTVQLWDPQTGKSLMILQGHKNSVISVALSPEGGLFATGSGDCKARLWKISQRPAPVPAVATTAAQQQSAPKLLLQ